ncbi:hypothetical protein [Neptuniibacter sp. QD37_11]|uniref:hypothetical protein n=1 Tax=Neptuniibacter sp. QD37_11 TaxID=3398209 RepID=UPI0039F634CD
MDYESYTEWEEQKGISPVSPEAAYAEEAWNAALNRLETLAKSAYEAEGCTSPDASRLHVLILDQISGLKTD